ncbi:MBOAT family O-acyltransferase [Aquimarina pacifica]|uniref:MBOAT family O-acyltransferase n=1 Tax=Aquimarina pacifica TaxID=1296415 RepID=UPI000471AC4A|nr:MBOAT family O-acyltransferase [Aquimarina pacifica]
MIFNSIDFAIFIPIVFLLYWFVLQKHLRLQNVLILVASYVFYGWWDWRFLSLIICSSVVDYSMALLLQKHENKNIRKLALWSSIFFNLGLLGFFKYYNFFIENFSSAFTFFGGQITTHTLHIILPVGISFYTFQTLSYTIDVYNKKLEPTKDFIAFSAFVAFFPQLVAGPIERAKNLLPQFYTKRNFDYTQATDGLRQILWGLFKKVVIADTCAKYANLVFNNSDQFSGSTLVMGALFFTFQIYGDFSGYSDIAIGTSRLFGFNLHRNFAFPYFSRDISEFWRRWHISLSTWFRDYLYIPLGGSRGGTWMKVRNTLIIFIVSGFWHGANWTFIIWGALNALYFLPLLLLGKNRKNITIVAQNNLFPSISEFVQIVSTFGLTVFAWIFFRANDLQHAFQYIGEIFSPSIFSIPEKFPKKTALLILLFVGIEWLGRRNEFAIEDMNPRFPIMIRWVSYLLIIGAIFYYSGSEQQFIYFQF